MICSSILFLSVLLVLVHAKRPANHSPWDLLPHECGQNRFDKSRKRIVQGDKAELGQFPWIAMIGQTEKNGDIFFFCAGSLISRYYVVSAAHCEDEGDIIRLGEHNTNTEKDCDRYGICAPPYQDIKAKKYIFHEFDDTSQTNDLSLIELSKPAKFNDFVKPICLPKERLNHSSLFNKTAKIAGWGDVDSENPIPPDELLYVEMPVIDPENCNSVYPHKLSDSQLCIGFMEGEGAGLVCSKLCEHCEGACDNTDKYDADEDDDFDDLDDPTPILSMVSKLQGSRYRDGWAGRDMTSQTGANFRVVGKDTCTGDSGGPASMKMKLDGKRRRYLIGVISYGAAHCGITAAVYTDVSYYLDWILDKIEKC